MGNKVKHNVVVPQNRTPDLLHTRQTVINCDGFDQSAQLLVSCIS